MPFIVWNLVFYLVYVLLDMIPVISSKINFEIPPFGFEEFVLDNTVNPPMWFLSRLLVLQFCSPLVLLMFYKLRKFNLIWLLILLIADLVIGFGYKNPLHWAFLYYFSGYLSFYHENIMESMYDNVYAKFSVA